MEFRFQSTPPARGGDHHDGGVNVPEVVISIHAPREGGDMHLLPVFQAADISIHAPREGGDFAGRADEPPTPISIHAPREGGDP